MGINMQNVGVDIHVITTNLPSNTRKRHLTFAEYNSKLYHMYHDSSSFANNFPLKLQMLK